MKADCKDSERHHVERKKLTQALDGLDRLLVAWTLILKASGRLSECGTS